MTVVWHVLPQYGYESGRDISIYLHMWTGDKLEINLFIDVLQV
jgi:hypothetical protein